MRADSKKYAKVQRFDILYNPSDGLLLDVIYELAAQKAVEKNLQVGQVFVEYGLFLANALTNLSDADKQAARLSVNNLIMAKLPAKTLDILSRFNVVVAGDLNAGIPVVLIPHSQGNMFGNEMYDALKVQMQSRYFRGLGVVNVATPAYKAPSALYITASEDDVIELARTDAGKTGLLLPLNPNVSATSAAYAKDSTGHGFSEVYLSKDLPTTDNSMALQLSRKVDTAIANTNTFYDTPNYRLDSNGNKVPLPVGFPASSAAVQVCFPEPVGGL